MTITGKADAVFMGRQRRASDGADYQRDGSSASGGRLVMTFILQEKPS